MLGLPGIWLIYRGTKREDQFLLEKYGNDYKHYMEKVPSMNIITGILRRARRKG